MAALVKRGSKELTQKNHEQNPFWLAQFEHANQEYLILVCLRSLRVVLKGRKKTKSKKNQNKFRMNSMN